jgi:hypothetical protein
LFVFYPFFLYEAETDFHEAQMKLKLIQIGIIVEYILHGPELIDLLRETFFSMVKRLCNEPQ